MLEARIFDLTIHCFPSIVCWPSWWPEAGELNRSSLTSSVVPRQLMKHSLGWGWDLYNETMVSGLQYSANVLYMYGYVSVHCNGDLYLCLPFRTTCSLPSLA